MVGMLLGDKFVQLVHNEDLLLIHVCIEGYNKMEVVTGMCVYNNYKKVLQE